MKLRVVAGLAVLLALTPGSVLAQLGLGARAGTAGVGAELAIDVTGPLVLRGGVGYSVLEPTVRIHDISWTLEMPSPWYNVGVDLFVNSALRFGGGLMFKQEDPRLVAELDRPVTLGGQQFTADELGSLVGTVDSGTRRPYALLGFGRHTRGSGLFLDLGVVWLGDSDVLLDSQGGTYPDQPGLEARLRDAESEVEADLGTYLKVWPILSIGARIAVG